MRRTALALSPHLDDAAFSCGGTLARLAREGWRVVVATMFTRTVPNPQGFALACQLDKGIGPDVDYMALRRREDEVAMRALGVEAPVHVALPEAPHRGYGSAPALFKAPAESDRVAGELAQAVNELLAEYTPDLLLAPQAIGGHVDHVQLVRVLDGGDRPVAWWRDFPYVARSASPAEPFGTQMAGLPEQDVRLEREDVTAKEAACMAYVSQLGFQFGGLDGLRAKLKDAGTIERFRSAGPITGTPQD